MGIYRKLLPALMTVMVVIMMLPQQGHTQTEVTAVQQELAERYVPVAYLRYQQQACGVPPYEGEPYLPLPVAMILDNPRVLIRDGANGDEVVATGPSAQELATFGPDTYMDFPGNPRSPGCTYETDERVRVEEEGLVPTTYANFIFDEEEGRLALQYWFYWYFNDWNNTHESDWEGIQLVWDDVDSIEAALDTHPSRIGYSQHGNGELADWGDSKVKLEEETHPLVYPAAGSHATFFSNDTFLAWGERSSGFGCDVSSPPSERVPLDVVVIPSEIDPNGEFAWLLYEGRWGERQPSAFNGPLGPMFNARWTEPFEVFETWRPFSIVVPDSTTLGPSMSEAFCTLTSEGSTLLLNVAAQPLILLPVIAIVVGALVYFGRKAMPVFRRARKIYTENWPVFLGIGLLSIPIGIVFNLMQRWLVGKNPLKFVVDYLDNTGGAYLTAVLSIGGVQQLAMLLIITPAVVSALDAVLKGKKTSVKDAYLGIIDRIGVIFLSSVIFLAVIGVLLLTAIGIPIAIWLAIRWHFFVQALVLDREVSPIEAFRRSARVVSGRWLRTFFSLVVYDLLAVLPGILVGFGLLTIGRTAVGFANGISSLFYAILIPITVIAVSLIYLDQKKESADYEPTAEPVVEPDVSDAEIAPGNA